MKFSEVIHDFESCKNNKIINCEGSKFLAFLHVPKTAGTSLLKVLMREYPLYYHMKYDQIDKMLLEFIEKQNSKQYDFFTGHFAIRHIRQMQFSNLDFNTITFIREPVSRLISDYRYQKTELHPPHKEFIEKFPTFESWALKEPPNIQLKKLLGHIYDIEDGYNQLVSKYAFIGVTELYDLSIKVLSGITGKDLTAKGNKLNVTKNLTINQINPSPEVINKLKEIHHIDIEIYKKVYSNYAKISNDIIKNQNRSFN